MDTGQLSKAKIIAIVIAGLIFMLSGVSYAIEPAITEKNGSIISGNESVNASAETAKIAPLLAPGVATLISPSGTLTVGKPTYTWTKTTDTQFYCLVVNNSAGATILKVCYDAASFSATATCSATPCDVLPGGSYTWRIQTWSASGSSWSGTLSFTVCSSSFLPARVSLVSPAGPIGYSQPVYTWNHVTGATQYRLKVVNVLNPTIPVIDYVNDTSELLSGTRCSIKPNVALAPGTYNWQVMARNCKGDGQWSSVFSFRFAIIAPGRANPLSPSGLISTCTPTYIWTTAPGAARYNIQVVNLTSGIILDEWVNAEDVTAGSRCQVFLPYPLQDDEGVYFWRVRAANAAGVNGTWSGYKYFETVCSCGSSEKPKMKSKPMSREDRRDAVYSMKLAALQRSHSER